jgi:hypothetical protein
MASWRDDASQEAQDDLDGLLNATLPFAQEMLSKRGEFHPFGAAVDVGGELKMVAGDPGAGKHPESAAVLGALLEGLRSQSGELRAAALVADVRVDSSDAIRVEMEHRDGHAMTVLMPYKKKRLGRGIEYASLQAGAATRQVWPSA